VGKGKGERETDDSFCVPYQGITASHPAEHGDGVNDVERIRDLGNVEECFSSEESL
jgi:hypothetical protein